MAKRRFNLDDNFNDVVSYIETPKENHAPVSAAVKVEEPEKKTDTPSREKESVPYSEPNKLFRRNITLSEEMFWRLNYIKDRKNKNRSDGDKFVTIDGLMFDMIQQCLDTQFASTRNKFEQYKNDDAEDWV